MAKLKNIIKQLSEEDFVAIYDSLIDSSADKSAFLLRAMREKQQSDNKIMEELDVNTNAYYTLRSRLNQKIEEYLLQQMENPRTDILKKVANINEIIFTKKRAIAVATLKKLEKELLDYDLSNELTIVYKFLKKLHINTADYFNYSQLYNKHVAYTLAVDKAEDLLAEYFKKYGNFALSGDPRSKMELSLMNKEMNNVCALYKSHRLYVYQSCINIYHRLYVEKEETIQEEVEPIEDIILNVQKIFEDYHLDSIYYHLRIVFEYLKLEYYDHYKVYRKAEDFFEEVNDSCADLLSNYTLFTYPAQFLMTKIKRHVRMSNMEEMYEENEVLFHDYEPDKNDVPNYITYVIYRSLSCYYKKSYGEAARWVNNLLNEISLKKFPAAQLEVKTILALHYCMVRDYDLFNQLINSIQRQIRLLGKDACEHVVIFTKMLKISISDSKKNKKSKIENLAVKIRNIEMDYFTPTLLVKIDEEFINILSKE
ncbi:MAG: hypothetical protein KAQ62_24905 [Cyclobacteriaceae bacterium]|nr:hypothetical protein [Cyclobacteriaceae bacterium]MCK5278793.1 hypothetical protein [Cyclobacteriaceae bacterium]MCK5371835.1 hypothetical protein [Cyclobacteriaceae bacterium]MCK5467566.1 hypothetical protein [Cyclobacteriaceae bacterium]